MKLDLPSDIVRVHHCDIPTRWGDMDAFQHINNAIYFRYMESARIEMLQDLYATQPGAAEAVAPGTGPVVINAFCNFLAQITHPATLRVTHFLGEIGRSSFDTYITMARTDAPDVPLARGGATVVWVHYEAGKAIALPAPLRQALVTLRESGGVPAPAESLA
ncbi:acyl-CoA thioesterase [Amphibiibacter pelophylacis]|uniref:Thioesterase family protein n=1 Tax=Amphibiibacter pelophylacis TaxID=1799477 RepID=A0ACC6NZY5_9BURK